MKRLDPRQDRGSARVFRAARVARRGLAGLLAVALLTAAVAAPRASAEAGAATTLQTVVGANGQYQVQVPSSWEDVPISGQFQVAGLNLSVDIGRVAPDRNAVVVGETISGEGLTAAVLPDLVKGALTRYEATRQAQGTGTFTQVGEPQSVAVAGADAATQVAATYTDGAGVARDLTIRAALQGQAVHLLILDASADFSQNDGSFATIVDSFQLTPPPLCGGGAA